MYLIELRSATWVALAEISGDMGNSMAIRHVRVRDACLCWAFLQMPVFNDANGFLWVLTRGDIKENLSLSEQNPISDADGACTMKILRPLLADFDTDQIVDGVRLLLYIGCGTFASDFRRGRLHPDISTKELSIRSALHQSRALFFKEPK